MADTTFVEVSRYQQQGVSMPDGTCNWSTATAIELPAGDPSLGFRQERTVSVDRRACVIEKAVGYRRALPPENTTGTGGVTASASWPAPSKRP
jgi:hypothetical protein